MDVMPFYWHISSRARVVEAQAEGRVTLADWREVSAVMVGARAIAYRKLLDARKAVLEMNHEDLMQVLVMARGYHEEYRVGPLAVVLPSEQGEQWSRILGALAAADRPFRIFTREITARRWLSTLAIN